MARCLRRTGWQVVVTGRDPGHVSGDLTTTGVQFVQADRSDAQALDALVRDGVELVVDCLCFTAPDARSLLRFAAVGVSRPTRSRPSRSCSTAGTRSACYA